MRDSVSKSAPVLVTGANGFVGQWVMRALRSTFPAEGAIISTGNNTAPVRAGDVHLDIRNMADIERLFAQIRPAAVVHLAALSQVQEASRDPRATFDVNFNGTMNLAEATLKYAPKARFIFISSSEIYGGTFNVWGRPLDETAPLDPTNPYAVSKAAADLLIGQMARNGLDAIRFRPFNHTGPGQGDRFVIPAFAAQIVRIERGIQEPVLRVGNLDAQRDFLDVRDVVDAYLAGLSVDEGVKPGEIFNLASETPRRIGDILEALLSRAHVPVRVEADPERMRRNDTPFAVGNASKAHALLHWTPKIAWEQTLDDVLASFRAEKH